MLCFDVILHYNCAQSELQFYAEMATHQLFESLKIHSFCTMPYQHNLASYATACRPSNKLSSTSLMSLRRGRCIKERWRKPRPHAQWYLTSLRKAPSLHHHQDPNDLPTVLPSLPTTVSTWRSRCSAPTTPSSPAPCTFSHQGSVQFLEYAAIPFPGRRLTSSMKLSTWGRAPMPSSACSTTSLRTMGWARREYTCIPTTVVGRTKMLSWCSTFCGE